MKMTKAQVVEALGYKGYEAKKAMRRTKEDLLSEYEVVNNVVDYTVDNDITAQETVLEVKDIVAEAPKAVARPKTVQYVRLFPDGVKVCQGRGLVVRKLEKDWKTFSDFVNKQTTKLLNDAWKEGKFTVLYKAMMVDPKNSKKWWALVTAKNTTNKKQCTCLFEGVEAKREFTGNIEYLKF